MNQRTVDRAARREVNLAAVVRLFVPSGFTCSAPGRVIDVNYREFRRDPGCRRRNARVNFDVATPEELVDHTQIPVARGAVPPKGV